MQPGGYSSSKRHVATELSAAENKIVDTPKDAAARRARMVTRRVLLISIIFSFVWTCWPPGNLHRHPHPFGLTQSLSSIYRDATTAVVNVNAKAQRSRFLQDLSGSNSNEPTAKPTTKPTSGTPSLLYSCQRPCCTDSLRPVFPQRR